MTVQGYIRAELEKLNFQMAYNIHKTAFEWCDKYELKEREKSRFLDGVKLGAFLQSQEMKFQHEDFSPPFKTYYQLWMPNDFNFYGIVSGRKTMKDGKLVLVAGFRNPTGPSVETYLDPEIYKYWAPLPDRPCNHDLDRPEYPYPDK